MDFSLQIMVFILFLTAFGLFIYVFTKSPSELAVEENMQVQTKEETVIEVPEVAEKVLIKPAMTIADIFVSEDNGFTMNVYETEDELVVVPTPHNTETLVVDEEQGSNMPYVVGAISVVLVIVIAIAFFSWVLDMLEIAKGNSKPKVKGKRFKPLMNLETDKLGILLLKDEVQLALDANDKKLLNHLDSKHYTELLAINTLVDTWDKTSDKAKAEVLTDIDNLLRCKIDEDTREADKVLLAEKLYIDKELSGRATFKRDNIRYEGNH